MGNYSSSIEWSFKEWVKRNKHDIILVLLPPIFSFLFQLITVLISELDVNWITNFRFEVIVFFHLSFLFLSLYSLGNRNYLKDVIEKEKSGNIMIFIEQYLNSKAILENGKSALFGMVRFTVKHFYFTWIFIWIFWIIQSLAEIVYPYFFDYKIDNTLEQICLHLHFFVRNLCYMIVTLGIFYIYFLLSKVPANVSENKHEFKWVRSFMILFLFVFCTYLICDFFGIFLTEKMKYTCFILLMTIGIGLFTCMSIVSVASRLNSPYLNVPFGIIFVLNVYAAIQVLYPLTIAFEILHLKGDGFGYSALFTEIAKFLNASPPNCNLELRDQNIVNNYYFAIICIYNLISLFGQVCFFFAVRWILDERRLIFYILCRAKTMAEHDNLLQHFNNTYYD